MKTESTRNLVDWTDEDSIWGDLLNSMRLCEAFVDMGRKVIEISCELEEWDPNEPGQSDCVFYDIILDWGRSEIRLQQYNKVLGVERFRFMADTDSVKLVSAIEELERNKGPKVHFFHYDTPSLQDVAHLEAYTER